MNGNVLVGILFLAVALERLWEVAISRPLFENVPFLKGYKWVQVYLTIALGVYFASVYNLDIVSSLTGLGHSTIGIVLTGFAIGSGSQMVHGLIKSQESNNQVG